MAKMWDDNYSPYQIILSRADSDIQLDHPLVTQLHEILVSTTDLSRSEKVLIYWRLLTFSTSNHGSHMPTRLLGTGADGNVRLARGGHAVCIDPVNEMIYIFR